MGLPRDKLPVLEEFVTIQGEGINLGVPYYFIRVGGCPLRCRYCDSEYTWTLDPTTLVDLAKVIAKAIAQCERLGIGWVSITGGEPMLYPEQLKEMMYRFHDAGLKTHIETSGRFYDSAVHGMSDIYSVDAKTPCTNEQMDGYFLGARNLRACDQVKCLIETMADMDYAYKVNQMVDGKCALILQPFNKSFSPGKSMAIGQVRMDVGRSFEELLNIWHASQEKADGPWKNVRLTPQVHVLAYGNVPST